LKILIINSRYFLSAGPEKYMFGLKKILEEEGHEFIPFSTKNSKNNKTKYEKYFVDPIGGGDKVYYSEYKKDPKTVLEILGRQYYSLHVKRKLKKLIKDTKPDIAYLLHHNNKLSPSVIDACKEQRLPVVMRLSDFFLVCAEGHLFRNDNVCEKCLKHSLFNSIRYKCVKNSIIGSIVKSSAMWFHRIFRIYDQVEYMVSPSKFTIEKLSMKFDKKKFVHIPTFVLKTEEYNPNQGKYFLIVGRIEKIKGIKNAIKVFKDLNFNLKIVGKSSTGYDDELKKYVKDHNQKNIEFTGELFGDDLKKIYKNAKCVILPTKCYENMPNVIIEAMMYSRPIIASNMGSLSYIIQNGKNGLLYNPFDDDDLKKKINKIYNNEKLCIKLGKKAYEDVIDVYNPKKHYNHLIKLFKDVVDNKMNMTKNQIKEERKLHYEIEKKLADKLRKADKEQRKVLYTKLYNKLYSKLPNHSRWNVKNNTKGKSKELNKQLKIINHYVKPNMNFLEVGPGNCLVSKTISKTVKQVYAIDVSDEVTRNIKWPNNFKFIVSDGSSIPVENNTIDLAYSHQLMEHLHINDAFDQLKNIFHSLKKGGKYVCITPNSFSGPHDVSQYYDDVATCFHLKEYTTIELINLFKKVGFKKIQVIIGAKGFILCRYFPIFLIQALEYLLKLFPIKIRRKISCFAPIRLLLGVKIVGVK
jgi:glycosyltransferase involved in cell wall biosynthesis/ubiquinone/menaquinone biosynthesis C-methylase UbiE